MEEVIATTLTWRVMICTVACDKRLRTDHGIQWS